MKRLIGKRGVLATVEIAQSAAGDAFHQEDRSQEEGNRIALRQPLSVGSFAVKISLNGRVQGFPAVVIFDNAPSIYGGSSDKVYVFRSSEFISQTYQFAYVAGIIEVWLMVENQATRFFFDYQRQA